MYHYGKKSDRKHWVLSEVQRNLQRIPIKAKLEHLYHKAVQVLHRACRYLYRRQSYTWVSTSNQQQCRINHLQGMEVLNHTLSIVHSSCGLKFMLFLLIGAMPPYTCPRLCPSSQTRSGLISEHLFGGEIGSC
jgi:hypothetical protein